MKGRNQQGQRSGAVGSGWGGSGKGLYPHRAEQLQEVQRNNRPSSIEKYQNLLDSRDTMLQQLYRAEVSGDQAKIKEYTKGLNTLNNEIWYQETHNPTLNEALKVQETLFNQQNK